MYTENNSRTDKMNNSIQNKLNSKIQFLNYLCKAFKKCSNMCFQKQCCSSSGWFTDLCGQFSNELFSMKKWLPRKSVEQEHLLWIIRSNWEIVSEKAVQFSEQQKWNSIYLHCIWLATDVSEADLSKHQHIKPKLSALQDTSIGKWKCYMFCEQSKLTLRDLWISVTR